MGEGGARGGAELWYDEDEEWDVTWDERRFERLSRLVRIKKCRDSQNLV